MGFCTILNFFKKKKYMTFTYTGDVNDGAVLVDQSICIINSIESVPDIIENIIKTAEKRIKTVSAYLM
ncbi:MAG: hypothetical protein ACFFDK_12040 [Promethearchaeota archaeon]